MNKIAEYISTLFGIGLFPKAPGTAGTLFAALVYITLPNSWTASTNNFLLFSAILILLTLFSVPMISKAEEKFGKDNGKIVLDEFFGYFVAILFLPKKLEIIIAAFILFRIFDILKPEPVNILQKLPKGWGVVVDDIMAGIYANLSLQFIIWLKVKII